MDTPTKKINITALVEVAVAIVIAIVVTRIIFRKMNMGALPLDGLVAGAAGQPMKGKCRSSEANCKGVCEDRLGGSYSHPFCYDGSGNIIPMPTSNPTRSMGKLF